MTVFQTGIVCCLSYKSTLTTRPLAWGGKVWAHAYNDVMEMVLQAFTCSMSLLDMTNLAMLCCNCVAKLRATMSRTVAIMCIVSQLISNYPCIIAVHGDNLNVGMYPDPSSSSNERSGPRVQ